jgi:glucose/arabinose dehydrogenase
MRIALAVTSLILIATCSSCDSPTPAPTPTPTPVNTAPSFTSSATASVQENLTGVAYQASATDAQSDAITFSIVGGADSALFTITNGGALSFNAPPNFEAPADAGADDVYNVQIRASDGTASSNLDLQLTVTNSREGIAVRRIATGFNQPVAVVGDPSVPPSHGPFLFVAERTGAVWRMSVQTGVKALEYTVGNLSTDGERGLLGMALYPTYPDLPLRYVYATAPDGTIEIRVYGETPAGYRTILSIPHPRTDNYGGWIGVANWNLYIATGDGGGTGDPDNNAQNSNSRLGKILRLQIDARVGTGIGLYPPTPGNPFIGGGGDPYVFALGLRSPFRATFATDGQLIIGDVGERAIEEIDFLRQDQPGLNFGWPFFEGSQPYRGTAPAGLTAPVTQYAHGTGPKEGRSVIGGYVYAGAIPSLQGLYVFGDAATGNIWTVPYAQLAQGTLFPSARYERRNADFAPDIGTLDRLVSFGEDTFRNLYLIDADGDIFQVVPAS